MVPTADLMDAREQRDRARAQLDAVRQTLNCVGAPTHDEQGRKLNANGRLVDWLAGKRVKGWIGASNAESNGGSD